MALQLYGFAHKTSDLELMVRAHTEEDAARIFVDYITQINTYLIDPPTLTLKKEILWTLYTSGFSKEGIINGGIPAKRSGQLAVYSTSNVAHGLTTPNASGNAITGDLTIVSYIQFKEYDSGVLQHVGAKWGSSTSKSYFIQFAAGGNPVFAISSDGSNGVTLNVNAFDVDNTVGTWIRATFTASNGNMDFYVSSQSPTTALASISWGTAINSGTSGVSTLFTSSDAIRVATWMDGLSGGSIADGYVYRMAFIAGINTTVAPVYDMYPDRDAELGVSSWTSGSATGETWTVHKGCALLPVNHGAPVFP